jgi:hypothetical protein
LTRIAIDPARPVGRLDRKVFGGFVGHLGRCFYGGLYEVIAVRLPPRSFTVIEAAMTQVELWRKTSCPGRGRCGNLQLVRAGTGRLSEGRHEMSKPVAGAFPPALFTAQPRSTTRARLFFTPRRVQLPPR